MKKFLIISDGAIGRKLIDRVTSTYSSENMYYIVQTTNGHDYTESSKSHCKFFTFDPTSFYKLSNLLKMDFSQVFITMQFAQDMKITIKNIRSHKQQLRIVVLDQFGLEFDDNNVVRVDANEILASRLFDFLPNVPVIAQNVGLVKGEIMEVLVPFGSSFVYRHVGVIEQNKWRIVAIYRHRELIMPNRRTMIQPNDLLLLVGEPDVLESVYRAIKRELGQFPAPFGSNLYYFIDMATESEASILGKLEHAEYVHQEVGHELIIKVMNPGDIDLLQKIKTHRRDKVQVEIHYFDQSVEKVILDDIIKYHIGLILVSRTVFARQSVRKALYEANIPVLSMSNKPISQLKDAVMILSENRDLEKVSTAIFDIAEQMGYNLELFNYTSEQHVAKDQVIEHYNNLASIFSKSIRVVEQDDNPIRSLRKKKNFLHCLPFTEKIVKGPFMSIFSTDSERLYYRLSDYPQLFIPVRI